MRVEKAVSMMNEAFDKKEEEEQSLLQQVLNEPEPENGEDDDDDDGMEPPHLEAPRGHPLFQKIADALQEVYDPEIPIDIYKLGLIYRIDIDSDNNIDVEMTLTAPGCPVAGEMPGMVSGAIEPVNGVGKVSVELVWDPPWTPDMMSDVAKLELGMF